MVEVPSSAGGFVQVEVKGIADVQRMLIAKGKLIKAGVDASTAQGANLLQQEVQQSIMGLRGETRSVRTGTYANSITVNKNEDFVYEISPEGTYFNGTPVEKIANILEYGTSYITERRHFRNSMARKEKEIYEHIDKAIAIAVKS